MTGFFNIDKREGVSSAYVTNIIKRITGIPAGHMGTLDPLASGVLPVALGNAARLFDYFLNKHKKYTARFRFGATTDTLDREGEPRFGGSIPTAAQIESVLPFFVGKLQQIPPLYSAKSVGGRRGYALARQGEQVELVPREVEIYAIELLEQTAPDEFAFSIECGGGTYIRAIGRDIAQKLSTQAYTTFLRRTESGVFTEKTAVPLESVTKENWREFLIPTDRVLPFPVLDLSDGRIFHGVSVPADRPDGIYKLYDGEAFYGTARVENGFARAEKKLC